MSAADEDKKQKQIAFLAPFVEKADTLLKHGIKSIRYWSFVDVADAFEIQIARCKTVLLEAPFKTPTTKEEKEKLSKEIKSSVESIDEMSDYAFYLFANALVTSEKITVDNKFKDDIDWAQMDYVAKVAKSVDNRHKHAPGFDSVGGAVRGSTSSNQ